MFHAPTPLRKDMEMPAWWWFHGSLLKVMSVCLARMGDQSECEKEQRIYVVQIFRISQFPSRRNTKGASLRMRDRRTDPVAKWTSPCTR